MQPKNITIEENAEKTIITFRWFKTWRLVFLSLLSLLLFTATFALRYAMVYYPAISLLPYFTVTFGGMALGKALILPLSETKIEITPESIRLPGYKYERGQVQDISALPMTRFKMTLPLYEIRFTLTDAVNRAFLSNLDAEDAFYLTTLLKERL